jgi:predicted nucleic acid-binding protein
VKPAAVDTNVLVRFATGDHADEHRAVTAALATRPWMVLTTVVLETEWVLRSVYGYSRGQFADFLDWMAGHDRIEFADAELIRAAAVHHRAGLDFADALHLEQARGGAFLTLDKALRRRAAKLGLKTEGC